jgi:hypothetical protein
MMSGWEIIEEIDLVKLTSVWIQTAKNIGNSTGKIWAQKILQL